MSRYDARQTPTPQPEPQRSQSPASAGRPWMDSFRRDAQEFGHVAEYEFRKVVGASRSLIQREPAPEPAPQKGSRAARFERKPIARRPEPERPRQERPQPEPVPEAKPVEQAMPQPE
jgi:hypothetical protein